jgi:hypothetical protein
MAAAIGAANIRLACDSRAVEDERMTPGDDDQLAVVRKKVLREIEDPAVAARYPNRTHFVSAETPRHGEMVSKALFAGDPVALIAADGHEVLFTPEHGWAIGAIAGLFLVLLLRLGSKSDGVVQLPPRTRIQARDEQGLPLAA